MKDLERYVERIVNSQTTDEAFDAFCEAMRYHGYDRIAYSLVNDHPSLGLPSQHGLATSYPNDWMKHYAARKFSLIDPVTRQVLTSRMPFFWSDVTARLDRRLPAQQMMDQAADAGLGDRIGISLRGEGPELVGVGIARSSLPASERTKPQDYNFLGGAYLLSTCLHETYRDLKIKSARAALSTREHDILSWVRRRQDRPGNRHHPQYHRQHRPVSLEEYLQETGGERPCLRDQQGAAPADHHPRLDSHPLPEPVADGARVGRFQSLHD